MMHETCSNDIVTVILCILITKFENLKIEEDKNINSYVKRMLGSANGCQNFSDPINKLFVCA